MKAQPVYTPRGKTNSSIDKSKRVDPERGELSPQSLTGALSHPSGVGKDASSRARHEADKGEAGHAAVTGQLSNVLVVPQWLLFLCLWNNLNQRMLHPHPRPRVLVFRMHPAALSFNPRLPAMEIREVVRS